MRSCIRPVDAAHTAAGPKFQERVREVIDDWPKSGADNEAIVKVREKIRLTALSRRRRKYAGAEGQTSLSKTARATAIVIYTVLADTMVAAVPARVIKHLQEGTRTLAAAANLTCWMPTRSVSFWLRAAAI